MDFSQTETEYHRLKAQVDSGQLTEADFRAQLQDLMVEDQQGQWWMLGYETGRWHVHNGETWVPADPFASVAAPIIGPPTIKADLSNATTAVQSPRAQPAAGVAPAAAATPVTPRALTWRALALIMVAWAACSGFWQFLYNDVGIYGVYRILAVGAWFLAGWATGVAMRLVEPAVRWRHILAGAIAWGACSLLTLPEVSENAPFVALFTLAALGGGLAMGLVLKQALTAMHWYHVFIVAAGWSIAFFTLFELEQLVVDKYIYEFTIAVAVIGGVFGGAIGGGVTLWQIRRAQKAAALQP